MVGRMPKGQWQVQQGGEKPSRELLVIAGLLTKNTAGAEGGFTALLMRDGGSNLAELGYGFNAGPAHNHNNVGLSQGTVNRPGPGYFYRSTISVGRWHMAMTAKGEKHIMSKLAAVTAQATSVSDKPAKAVSKPKGASKPKRKGKVAPAETPTSEPYSPDTGGSGLPGHEILTPEANVTPVTEPVEIGGVDPQHDEVTPAELQGLAEHFNS
jgi:hypothetical protein